MGGVLIANPIPESRCAATRRRSRRGSPRRCKDAEREGVARKELTPFLLKRIFELTERQEPGRQYRAGREQRRGGGARSRWRWRSQPAAKPSAAMPARPRRRRCDDRRHRQPGGAAGARLRPARHDPQSCRAARAPTRRCWLASDGVEVAFRGARRRRATATLQKALLARFGVEPILARRSRSCLRAACHHPVDPDGERSFLTDRGANLNLCAVGPAASAARRRSHLLHVSGYALFEEGPRAAVLELMGEAERRRIPISVDPAVLFVSRRSSGRRAIPRMDARGASSSSRMRMRRRFFPAPPTPMNRSMCFRASIRIVAIKRGSEGAVAAEAASGGRWSASAPSVRGRRHVGRGRCVPRRLSRRLS